ncbi:hypothetical protein AB0A69_28385, partial [Streptomyces sp. NPDC045431]|uniref:hypothetical protein n=1 Tax=Streptomyces sp. NPDC045431 TaxID=3155613 RepID=UPI0033F9335E
MYGAGKRYGRTGRVAAALGGMLLLAGCGAGEPDDPKAKPSAHAKAPAPLTEAQLTAAAFAGDEKAGAYTTSPYRVGEAPFSDHYTADPAVCQPLVSLAKGATAHDPVAEVHRDLSADGGPRSVQVTVQLRSYAAGDATAVMAALGKAGTACAAGFTEQRTLAEGRYLKVEPVKAPAVGDEAKAFRFTLQDVKNKDLRLYEYLTVVRSGSTTLAFRAEVLDTKDFGGVPQEVVTAQWE